MNFATQHRQYLTLLFYAPKTTNNLKQSMTITVGLFIMQQLHALNIDRINGVPGDAKLSLLELYEQNPS